MSPPQVIVFDLGKVLLDFDYRIAMRNLAPFIPGNLESARAILQAADLLGRYEQGHLATCEFFEEARRQTGMACDFATFEEHFCNIFTEIPAMIALNQELRARGLSTYLLSNTNELQAQYIQRRFPCFTDFDGRVLSYEHGCMKPAARIYEIVETLARCRGAELAYIDDRPENVAAAELRGWQGVVHVSPEATRAALRKMGLPL